MKTIKQVLTLFAISLAYISAPAFSAGLMKPINSTQKHLQIKEHHVDVTVSDGYATTEIVQSFHNPNNASADAIYTFPVPSNAAVSEFSYWINGSKVVGEVVERKKARAIYEEEKKQGNKVALVEQTGHKSFDIFVAAVPAGERVKVKLVYLQRSLVDAGIGRYHYPLEEGGVDSQKHAFWHQNSTVEEAFSFKLKMRSSYPVDSLRLPNHPNAAFSQHSPQEWTVVMVNYSNLPSSDEKDNQVHRNNNAYKLMTLDQDIVAYWRLAPNLPGSLEMTSYKPTVDGRGTFMMTLTPGDDLQKIQQGRDWVFVLDISGSMSGKYSSLIEGVKKGLEALPSDDRFKVVLFNNNATELSKGFQKATPNNVVSAINRLEKTRANGGTNLHAGLKLGLRSLDADRSVAILLVTDGVANVGLTEKKAFLKLLKKADVRLFSFIMGNSANRPLLEGMTNVSQGFYQEISNSDDIVGQILLATQKLDYEALRNLKIDFSGVKVSDLSKESIGTLYSGQQLVLFGHYWQGGEGTVSISGQRGGEILEYKAQIDFPKLAHSHPQLERLWTFAAIEALMQEQQYYGEDEDRTQAVVDLAIENSLVTPYTSMLVLEENRFEAHSIEQKNKLRVEKEVKALAQNQAAPVHSNQVSQSSAPVFGGSRGSVGGGSIGYGFVLLMLLIGIGPKLASSFLDPKVGRKIDKM